MGRGDSPLKVMANYIRFVNRGTTQAYSNTSQYKPQWDDDRYPATGISIGGLSTPPDIETDTGLFLFDSVAIETFSVLAQMKHARKEDSNIIPHIHWRKVTSAAGGVVWSLRYKWWNNNEEEPGSWSSIITATDVWTIGSNQLTNIATFGEIDGTGKGLSSLFLAQVGRLPTDAADTYGADAKMYEFDIHFQADTMGSQQEYTK